MILEEKGEEVHAMTNQKNLNERQNKTLTPHQSKLKKFAMPITVTQLFHHQKKAPCIHFLKSHIPDAII